MPKSEQLSVTDLKQQEKEHRIQPHHGLKANQTTWVIIAKMREICRNKQQIRLTPLSPHVRLEARSNRINQPAMTQ